MKIIPSAPYNNCWSHLDVTWLTKPLLLLMGVVFGSSSLFAETESETEQRWFSVEVIVFKHLRASREEELWENLTTLDYSENQVDFLTKNLFPEPEDWPKPPADDQSIGIDSNESTLASAEDSVLLEDTEQVPSNENTNLLIEPFSLIKEDEFTLSDIYTSLSRSSLYRPLLHTGWKQPIKGRAEAESVRIVGGKNYFDDFTFEGEERKSSANGLVLDATPLSPTEKNTRTTNTSNNEVVDSLENSPPETSNLETLSLEDNINYPEYVPVPEIDGAIQIYLGRYLHVNTNLYIRQPGEQEVDISALNSALSETNFNDSLNIEQDTDNNTAFDWSFNVESLFDESSQTNAKVTRLLNYPMVESRRVRSKEVHYFDHPLFGLIIEIRPIDIEEIRQNNVESDNLGK